MNGHWVHNTATLCWSYKLASAELFVIPDELLKQCTDDIIAVLLVMNGLPPLPPDARRRIAD